MISRIEKACTHGEGPFNTLRFRQNGRHFPDDIFRCIFLDENEQFFIKFSLKFVLKGPINKIPSLVQIVAWRRPGDKPLYEPMMVSLLTHTCVTGPPWVKRSIIQYCEDDFFEWIGITYTSSWGIAISLTQWPYMKHCIIHGYISKFDSKAIDTANAMINQG